MTAEATRAALERIMRELAGAERSGDVVPRWGETGPSERSLTRQRIASPAEPVFAALEVSSWDDGAIGGAEVEFRPAAEPSLADLTEWFGPFGEVPMMPFQPARLRGEWWREGMPVRIVLLVEEREPVRALVLQRGISRPAWHEPTG